MNKVFILICYHLGFWGILGFLATLIFGFIACCTNLSQNNFFASLIIFAALGLIASTVCVARGCMRKENL